MEFATPFQLSVADPLLTRDVSVYSQPVDVRGKAFSRLQLLNVMCQEISLLFSSGSGQDGDRSLFEAYTRELTGLPGPLDLDTVADTLLNFFLVERISDGEMRARPKGAGGLVLLEPAGAPTNFQGLKERCSTGDVPSRFSTMAGADELVLKATMILPGMTKFVESLPEPLLESEPVRVLRWQTFGFGFGFKPGALFTPTYWQRIDTESTDMLKRCETRELRAIFLVKPNFTGNSKFAESGSLESFLSKHMPAAGPPLYVPAPTIEGLGQQPASKSSSPAAAPTDTQGARESGGGTIPLAAAPEDPELRAKRKLRREKKARWKANKKAGKKPVLAADELAAQQAAAEEQRLVDAQACEAKEEEEPAVAANAPELTASAGDGVPADPNRACAHEAVHVVGKTVSISGVESITDFEDVPGDEQISGSPVEGFPSSASAPSEELTPTGTAGPTAGEQTRAAVVGDGPSDVTAALQGQGSEGEEGLLVPGNKLQQQAGTAVGEEGESVPGTVAAVAEGAVNASETVVPAPTAMAVATTAPTRVGTIVGIEEVASRDDGSAPTLPVDAAGGTPVVAGGVGPAGERPLGPGPDAARDVADSRSGPQQPVVQAVKSGQSDADLDTRIKAHLVEYSKKIDEQQAKIDLLQDRIAAQGNEHSTTKAALEAHIAGLKDALSDQVEHSAAQDNRLRKLEGIVFPMARASLLDFVIAWVLDAKAAIKDKTGTEFLQASACSWENFAGNRVTIRERRAFGAYVQRLSGDPKELERLTKVANKRGEVQFTQLRLLNGLQLIGAQVDVCTPPEGITVEKLLAARNNAAHNFDKETVAWSLEGVMEENLVTFHSFAVGTVQ